MADRIARVLIPLAAVAIILSAGCKSEPRATSHDGANPATAPAPNRPREEPGGDFEMPLPHYTVPSFMYAKLGHSQAILEGLALGNFHIIESNAVDLKAISERSQWLVDDSEAYMLFSSDFRAICDDMIRHARNQDLQPAARAYARLSDTCINCHAFLRIERQTRDIPAIAAAPRTTQPILSPVR